MRAGRARRGVHFVKDGDRGAAPGGEGGRGGRGACAGEGRVREVVESGHQGWAVQYPVRYVVSII